MSTPRPAGNYCCDRCHQNYDTRTAGADGLCPACVRATHPTADEFAREQATPRPWNWIQSRTLIHVETDCLNPVGAGRHICSLSKCRTGDAELIVLAVNEREHLLAQNKAMREALETCDQWFRSGSYIRESISGGKLQAAIRAALAFARKEQP